VCATPGETSINPKGASVSTRKTRVFKQFRYSENKLLDVLGERGGGDGNAKPRVTGESDKEMSPEKDEGWKRPVRDGQRAGGNAQRGLGEKGAEEQAGNGERGRVALYW